ncbi:MAG: limonene-1,2-epoxide hydrolase family protein [Pseudomonadota bacterium]
MDTVMDKTVADARTVVEEFLQASSELDMDAALALIADDCVYQNVPFHTARGKRNVAKALQGMGKAMTEFKVDMINIASNGDVVMTERVDTLGGKFFRAELPVMGVFVVKNGKITEWRDYFDWSLSFGKFIGSVFTTPFRK